MLNTAACVLATSPDASDAQRQEAVELATRAVELAKEEAPAPLDTLAAAYAETRQFPLAIETASKAMKLALWQKNAGLAKVIGARISLYEDGKPYREPPPAIKKTRRRRRIASAAAKKSERLSCSREPISLTVSAVARRRDDISYLASDTDVLAAAVHSSRYTLSALSSWRISSTGSRLPGPA